MIVPRVGEGRHKDVIGALGVRPLGLDLVRSWPSDVIHVQFAVTAFGRRTREPRR